MKYNLSHVKYGGPIGIGISLMFMLTVSTHSINPTTILTFIVFGFVVGSFIAFSYISTSKLLSRYQFYNDHFFLKIIHSYVVCTSAFFTVSTVITLLPWSFFPGIKVALFTSMGVGIVAVMICFFFEYLDVKEETIRLEQKNKELAVVEERNRIARELHDSVSQNLFGISLNLNTLGLILEGDPEKAKAIIKQLKEMVGEVQTEMRLMIYELQPVILKEKGFFEALETLIELYRTRYNLNITYVLKGDDNNLDDKTQLSLYRVIQEALTNIVKHAEAGKTKLSLSIDDTGVVTKIEDNGKGFDWKRTATDGHFGLQGIKERIFAIDGDFQINSTIGQGTTITVKI